MTRSAAGCLLAGSAAALLILSGCGGSGSSVITQPPPPPAVHKEWTWQGGGQSINQTISYGTLGVASSTNNPGGRESGISWTDASGAFWLFGGLADPLLYGDNTLNDLWKYSDGQWTWVGGPDSTGGVGVYGTVGTPAARNIPGSRFGATASQDKSGNLWLFGGSGYDSTHATNCLNDLWKFSNSQWTWVSGPSVATGAQSGTYGVLGTPSPANLPGGRMSASSWTDIAGNFWLFGGMTFSCTADNGVTNYLNDLWEFSNGQWTWVGGSSTPNQPGVYGTQGTPAAANVPGARYAAATWTDAQGAFWLFGGFFYANGDQMLYNDLWKFSGGQWTWVAGSASPNQPGVYGTLGTASASNIPGSRSGSVAWTDTSGNLWLFGGGGYDSMGNLVSLNDLWQYNHGQWTWIAGSNVGNAVGVFGTQGVPATTNVPGARSNAYPWVDASGNLWLYGGYGGMSVYLSDLWEFQP